jgi:tetratricopeptide (TPR) repeat protein
MLKDHPFTGVGLDRYGSYFKEYRESTYSLKYGFDITSTNAHNVPIQIFATAGLIAGIAYLILVAFIFWRGIHAIRISIGNDKIIATGIFASWLSYQAQSIISIDNIGISVWGWLLGGAVIGISVSKLDEEGKSTPTKARKGKNQINLRQALISGSFALLAIIFSVSLLRTESEMFKQRMVFNPQVAENRSPLHEAALRTLRLPLLDPNYSYQTASNLIATGFTDEGLGELKKLNETDPRNLEALNYLAAFNEYNSNYALSIQYRKQIAKLDPWNSKNLLQLGRSYKVTGDLVGMESALKAILSFDQISPEANNAKIELSS